VIIGVKKGGTTSLLGWLERHPNVRTSVIEQHYFDKFDVADTWRQYIYQNSFLLSPEELRRGVVTIEKTPSYIFSETAPRNLYQLMPRARLILILRDPVARAYSGWQHNCRMKRYSFIAREVVRVSTGQGSVACSPDMFEKYLDTRQVHGMLHETPVIQRGFYAQQLERWSALDLFEPSQFLVLFTEDFVSKPFETMGKVEAFLDVGTFDYRSVAYKNARSSWDISGVPSKVGRFRKYGGMTPLAERILRNEYRQHNRDLEALLIRRFGFDRSWKLPW